MRERERTVTGHGDDRRRERMGERGRAGEGRERRDNDVKTGRERAR